MTVVGLDDTDSRTRGMCTTYVASQIAKQLRQRGANVSRLLLVRLNPAVEYKTRGNAALAIHVDCEPETAFRTARETIEPLAETADERTNPGLVVADHDPAAGNLPTAVSRFAERAIQDHLEVEMADRLITDCGYRSWHAGNGRGRIGALAAIGAWDAIATWTYEYISYREPRRWGTERTVDTDSVLAAADWGYPTVWDTVDRGETELVCVPHTPGPILHGIRGDDPTAVRTVAERIESEPVDSRQLFVTNQGTDSHLQPGTIGDLENGRAYRVRGQLTGEPVTRRGGHVFLTLAPEDRDGDSPTLPCAAFEPTKRFRDHVRRLRVGDVITACGEVSDGTLKLEKFAVRDLVDTESVTPTCPDCGRSMKSAGRTQGYRCRDCKQQEPARVAVSIERDLETGWYEVPPCARRHVAKPLVRGGFDAPTHPER